MSPGDIIMELIFFYLNIEEIHFYQMNEDNLNNRDLPNNKGR